MKNNKKFFPLMKNNITKNDVDTLINYLKSKNVHFTQNKKVKEFENLWSKWLGVKYSVFVNSGSSANLLSIASIRNLFCKEKGGEIIVPALTWVSDVASVIQNNFKPIFVDIDLKTLSMDNDKIIKAINKNTKAVFLTHAQGFNGLSQELLKYLKKKNIPLIEDVCESHGAFFKKKKLGSYGLISNFSFYYAHHMSTIEGGMICTNNNIVYQHLRMLRSHGLVREMNDTKLIKKYIRDNNSLNKEFIFTYPSYNVRSTELNAVIGINQIKNLDANIKKRNINHQLFLKNLDSSKFITNFKIIGSSNYAFNLILKKPNFNFAKRIEKTLLKEGIEFRKGSAGGGNQLRQPYLKNIIKTKEYLKFKNTEHVHFFGYYIGNYPTLNKSDILHLCKIINSVK